jgi:apolipoprotein N-acyltransferase
VRILKVFKLDLKEKIVKLKNVETYYYLISGIMLIIGIPFPNLNLLFYLSFIYLSYKLYKNDFSNTGLFYFLIPYFLIVGVCIWNEIFPWVFGIIPIGIILSVLLCSLISNLGYLFLTRTKLIFGRVLLLPAFFFLFDYLFQKIPYIKYIEIPIVIGSIYNHTHIIRLLSIFGAHTALFIIVMTVNLLTITIISKRLNKINISLIVLAILLFFVSNYTVDSCVSLSGNGVKISAVQPNLSMDKLNYSTYEERIELIFDNYSNLIKEEDSDIFVFPEEVIGLLDRENIKWKDTIDRIIELSKEKDAYIAALVLEGNSITKKKEERFITSLLVSPEGIVGKSRKRNLVPFGETSRYSKGSNYQVFKTEYGKIGISICYDINSNTVEKLKRNGAEIIIAPFNDRGFGAVFHNIHSYYPVIKAVENNIPIVVANEDGISQIIDSNGSIITRLNFRERGVISARFNIKPTRSIYLKIGKILEKIMFIITILVICFNIYKYYRKLNKKPLNYSI